MNNVLMAGAVASAASLGMCADASAQSSAVQWTTASGGNGHWYEVDTNPAGDVHWTFDEAQEFAQSRGAHLATFSNLQENSSVYSLLSIGSQSFAGWFGLVQMPGSTEPGGGWGWVTGEPLTFSNWQSGEPSNAGCYQPSAPQNWGTLEGNQPGGNQQGRWDDDGNPVPACQSTVRRAIIEWSADCNSDGIVDYGQCLNGTLPDYNGNNIPDCCDQGVACVAGNYPVQWRVTDGGNDHWYQGVTTEAPVSWTSARARAVALGSQLAAIGSRAEDDFVARLALENPLVWPIAVGYGPWLGGYQTSPSTNPFANWAWVTGEPWSYVSDVVEFDNSSRPDGQTDDYLHYINHSRVWNDVRNDGDTYYNSIGIRAYMAEWSADCNNDGIVDYGQILSGQLTDANSNGIPDSCEIGPCPGDISGNHSVDGVDLAALLGTWGTNGQGEFDCDIDNDGIVGGPDLTIILGGWGPCAN